MKYRTQSASVLNEADRFQAILDWQLFCMEQENMLWGYDEKIEWRPGEPIWMHPSYRFSIFGIGRFHPVDSMEGPIGNHVRPMLEEFDDGENYPRVRCETCEVSWTPSESDCWVCGKSYPTKASVGLFSDITPEDIFDQRMMIYRSSHIGQVIDVEETSEGLFATVQYSARDAQISAMALARQEIAEGLERELGERWRTIMQASFENMRRISERMNAQAQQMAEAFRGMSSQLHVIDEASHFRYEGPWPIPEPSPPPVRISSPFQKQEPEIELVPKVYVDNTWEKRTPWRPGVGRLLREAGPDIFDRPPIPVPQFDLPGYDFGNARNEPRRPIGPITEQRRRRNI